MLGMYVHTHWGYNRPYGARRWTVADWEGYLDGLQRLGYDRIMVWPQLDCMPSVPTPSDEAWLHTVSSAIDLAHERFGMKVFITLCPNTIGNAKAADYEFGVRPYFVCEERINPADRDARARFLEGRRRQLGFLANADALAIIDSDPGGYIGSTNAEFVGLCRDQIAIMREINPQAELIYWMLAGWESYNAFWARVEAEGPGASTMWADWRGDDFPETLRLLKAQIPEPWWLFGWLPKHLAAIREVGLTDKAMGYPYGVIEGEPTFPLTNCAPTRVIEAVAAVQPDEWPRGYMANAQTHCLQLPHTFAVAHAARGGTAADFRLADFAEDLLPGQGTIIAEAWSCLEGGTNDRRRALADDLRRRCHVLPTPGPLGGLLFGDPVRFITDLAANLSLRAALDEMGAAIAADCETRQAVGGVMDVLAAYQRQLGFEDAYGGPLFTLLNVPLAEIGDEGITRVLTDFSDWTRPDVRNGIVPRLLAEMARYAGEQGVDTHRAQTS